MDFDCIVLGREEFDEKYNKAFEEPAFTDDFTEDDLCNEFNKFTTELREQLTQNWIEDSFEGDFELSEEFQGSFHNCGGIYTRRIFCKKYVDTIIEVMSKLPHASEWYFHSVIEQYDDEEEGLIPYEEFFIRDGKVYAVELD